MDVKSLLTVRLSTLAPQVFELTDDSAKHIGHVGAGSGGHFSLIVVSKHFVGLSRLARHRAVIALIGDLIPEKIHALSLKAYAPDDDFDFVS